MRQPIQPLPSETVNRIAAGEVVERPASVLKELLENALDAGASRIELEIARGGVGLIRLSDDGHGIPRDELAEALERHSTSKIRSLADVEQGATLGFRGEALAAIASVSLLEISSRIEEDESAWLLECRGGEIGEPRPVARSRGCTVSVRELFGDVPARRKFLRSEAGEKRALMSVWQTYLLAYPELDFVLREGGRELAYYPAVDGLRERAAQVLDANTVRHMVDVSGGEDGYRVTGLTTLPLISHGNRSHQHFYLGRRPIQDGKIAHAVSQAYSEILAPGRFPACLLFMEIPSGNVDVNVHPAKREVRFKEPRRIHHLVSQGLRQAISGQGDLQSFLADREDLLIGSQPLDIRSGDAESQSHAAAARAASTASSEQQSLGLRPGDNIRPEPGGEALGRRFLSLSGAPDSESPDIARREERLFWQLHQTFILTQIRGALVIIDQHNAHERVLFDNARRALQGEAADSQHLLFPHTVDLAVAEMEAFREQTEFFQQLGFIIEEFGPRTLSVTGIPDHLQRWDGGKVIHDILEDIVAETGGPSERRDRALASYSCKSAIKAGEPMREEEMRHLVDQLFGTENPYTCPHGRPIVIRISMDELEKRFHRQVPEIPSGE